MYKFFAFLNRMKHIERWSLMRSTSKENIMEHTQSVAVIAHAIASIGNKMFNKNYNTEKVLLISQYHESAEVITGDLPTPIKYFNPKIKTAYKELEVFAVDKLIAMLPNELKEDYSKFLKPDTDCIEYKLMKAADKISAYIKCIEELKVGNSEFRKAKITIESELEKYEEEEIQYFIANFLPAYNLTLDELD